MIKQKTNSQISTLKSQLKSGFSLLEVIVFVAILSIFFVTAASVVTVTIKNMKFNEDKIIATRFAEELMEFIKGEKEDEWPVFSSHASTTGTNWCFKDLTFTDWPSSSGACGTNSYELPKSASETGFYRRNVILTSNSDDSQVTIAIVVEWKDRDQVNQVKLNGILTAPE